MNIYDYFKYYKDISFSDIGFNEVDALLFAIFSYIPVKSIPNGVGIKELNDILSKVEKEDMHGAMADKIVEIIDLIKDSIRYKEVVLSDLEMVLDDKVQFGALTIRTNEFTYISFEGTNASIVGWVENFRLAAKYPTDTQVLAFNYLNKVIKDTDKVIYVGGHSKGGNLAMCSVMNARPDIQDRIVRVYNFDGPGFRKEELSTNNFKVMNSKCINVLPGDSIVGILLNNVNYKYINSNEIGYKQHYPTNWNVFGTFLVDGTLSTASTKIKESLDKSLNKLDYDDASKLVEATNKFFLDNSIIYSRDVKNMNFEDYRKMINDYKEIDPETKKTFVEIFKLLLNPKKY